MPRGKRYILPGQVYHVTHRCHQRAFLMKFKRDRDTYKRMLRDRLSRFGISLFNYAITSNHVHLLLKPEASDDLSAMSSFMQSLEGDFARYYNRRKNRQNAFWGDRYHATMIEPGPHLWRCMLYVDLNMVRAGQVRHPRDWEWCGFNELVGRRKRYRFLDIGALLEYLDWPTLEAFRAAYTEGIEERLKTDALRRESLWTESLAVGSETFVRRIGKQIAGRTALDYAPVQATGGQWRVRETPVDYA